MFIYKVKVVYVCINKACTTKIIDSLSVLRGCEVDGEVDGRCTNNTT